MTQRSKQEAKRYQQAAGHFPEVHPLIKRTKRLHCQALT